MFRWESHLAKAPHRFRCAMPRFYPLTRGNVNPPLALAKPVARDPSRLRHCHPGGNALVHVYGYFTTDSTNLQGDPNANQPNGYLQSEWVRSGALADAKLSDLEGGATELKSYTYDNTITDGNGNYTYPLASESDYPSGSAVTTNYTNTAYPGSLQLQEVETQLPGVTADQNGPSANGNDHRATSFEWYDENGNAVWDEDALGTYTFNYYNPATGNLLATIQERRQHWIERLRESRGRNRVDPGGRRLRPALDGPPQRRNGLPIRLAGPPDARARPGARRRHH